MQKNGIGPFCFVVTVFYTLCKNQLKMEWRLKCKTWSYKTFRRKSRLIRKPETLDKIKHTFMKESFGKLEIEGNFFSLRRISTRHLNKILDRFIEYLVKY